MEGKGSFLPKKQESTEETPDYIKSKWIHCAFYRALI